MEFLTPEDLKNFIFITEVKLKPKSKKKTRNQQGSLKHFTGQKWLVCTSTYLSWPMPVP